MGSMIPEFLKRENVNIMKYTVLKQIQQLKNCYV